MELKKESFTIKKGLDIQLEGEAVRNLKTHLSSKSYIFPTDFRWFVPKLLVKEGDPVTVGTPLFCKKRDERVCVVSPVNGKITQIVRGEKRVLEVIEIENEETSIPKRCEIPENLSSSIIQSLMLQNGLWPMLRQRPFSVIPSPDKKPKSLFISCFDSSPLAPDFFFLLNNQKEMWQKGVEILKLLLGEIPIYLGLNSNDNNSIFEETKDVNIRYFSGPHPVGNVGTQIHLVDPINKGESVWFIHPQDVVTIGRFFLKGELSFDRIVALTGPELTETGYWKVNYGSDLKPLLMPLLHSDNVRLISGNVLTGSKLSDFLAVRFYDCQVTALQEGGEREFLGWLLPGLKKWSFSHTYLSFLFPKKKFNHNTSLNGGKRTFVMTDIYDKVFPFDIIPLSLLKACVIKDIEMMEALGIYEVDTEDFALCEAVCPSKIDCQQIVYEALEQIWNELK